MFFFIFADFSNNYLEVWIIFLIFAALFNKLFYNELYDLQRKKIKEHVGVNENFQHISLIYYVIETFVIVVLYVLEYAAEFLPFGG